MLAKESDGRDGGVSVLDEMEDNYEYCILGMDITNPG